MEETEEYEFVEHKKIDAFSTYQDTAKYGREFKVAGELVLKKMAAIEFLNTIAREKREVVFALGTGEATMVIIKNIRKTRTLYNGDGSFHKQNFDVQLQEVLS